MKFSTSRTSTACALALLVATGCSQPSAAVSDKAVAAQSPETHDDHDDHVPLPKVIALSPDVIADAHIRVAPVTKERLEVALSLPGEISADPDRTARISAPVDGRIETVSFQEGMAVKKGDTLAVIRVPELGKLRAASTTALAKAFAARTNATRLRALLDQRLASEQAAVDAESTAASLEAEAKSLGEQLGAIGASTTTGAAQLVLRAPLSGTVVARDAITGQPITSDQTLGTITDLRELWFLARVFEKDLGQLRVGAKAEVQLNAYPSDGFEGKVEYLGQQIDPTARTVTARIRLLNRDGLLRIGLFGTARVATGESKIKEATLVVPRSALVEVAGKTVVFVRHADGDFELHDVVIGESAVGKVEILSGLRDGETVVIDGAFTLKTLVLRSTLAEAE